MSEQMGISQQEHELLLQFLCIALGGNSFLHAYIEECYQKNEWEYYEAYQKSDMRGNPLFSMYTTKNEEKIRQVAGMVEWCYQNRHFYLLDQLIKKGYKFAYLYLQQHTQIDFDHFMRSFAKRQKGKMIKEIELIYQNIVLWYLSVQENKPILTDNVAWKSFQKVLNTSINEMKLQKVMISQKMFDKHKEEINHLYEEYNIPKNHRFDSLGVFLEYLISEKLKEISAAITDFSQENAEELVFQYSPVKYIGAFGGWLKTLKIHELDATEQIPFTKRDLDSVFLELVNANKYSYITKDEQDLFFIACLYLKCLSSLFSDTKKLYLDQAKQDYYLEMKSKESRIHEQEAYLLRRQQEWKLTTKGHQEEIEGLSKELREAQAKIKQLEQKIESMEDYTEEVHALRNFVYLEEHPQRLETAPALETMIELIESKRIVIFGGTPTWQTKLKEYLRGVEFIDVDEKNRDISKIQRVDAVFINTAVFAHAFYKKIMKELSKCKTPLFYINGQHNMEKTTLEIYKSLTK